MDGCRELHGKSDGFGIFATPPFHLVFVSRHKYLALRLLAA